VQRFRRSGRLAPRTTPEHHSLARIRPQVICKLRRPLDPPQREIGALADLDEITAWLKEHYPGSAVRSSND